MVNLVAQVVELPVRFDGFLTLTQDSLHEEFDEFFSGYAGPGQGYFCRLIHVAM